MKKSFVIDGFEKLTKQQLFDMSAHHIQSTGVKSVEKPDSNICIYGGTGCAAAPFIKPEYREGIKGFWPPVMYQGRHHEFAMPEHEAAFVQALQGCHDGAHKSGFMENWKQKMRNLAYKHGLSTAALK